MRVRTERVGGLGCRLVGPSPRQAKAGLVLMHGFGAPGDDLVPLAQELLYRAPDLKDVLMVFPEAPIDLGAMAPSARAWWMIDIARIQAHRSGGLDALKRLRSEEPNGLSVARGALESVLSVLASEGLPWSRTVVGGFSQGSMLATDVTLRAPQSPAGLAILSGTLICETAWRQHAALHKGLRVFQSHGTDDVVLPFLNAEALRELLSDAGLAVEFFKFSGGHTIPSESVAGLVSLVRRAAEQP
ncbi:MAG: alpha/beta hydrolase [Myxococcaceae bacterium]